MTVPIRAAVQADYESLCAILEEGDVLHRQKLPAFFRQSPDGVTRARELFSSLLEDPQSVLLVAEEPVTGNSVTPDTQAMRITGAVLVVVRETPPVPILVPRRYAVIDNVIVRAEWRGRGIGQALMEAAETWALSLGAEMVELTVYLFNRRAIRFYEELGYSTLSQRMIKPLVGRSTAQLDE